ncbi:hypothetical protein FRB90_007770 [Tulasnella sp. 427]|nr:hypothetical protein FRB90_007770 [Tulasnella sp. 427]
MSSSADQNQSSPDVSLSTRPPVTDHEAGTILNVRQALAQSETFYLSGTLDLATLGVTNPTLFYSFKDPEGGEAARMLSLINPPADALDALHAGADPAHFGHGKELVHDESYRLARDLHADKFNLNFDPISVDAGVLPVVSAFAAPHLDDAFQFTGTQEQPADAESFLPSEITSWRDIRYIDELEEELSEENEPSRKKLKTGVQAKLYKLNAYMTGGHFKKHLDTPKATNHIGTLLFGLPAPFSGGQLTLQHEGETTTVDWSGASSNPSKLPWVFFYSDVEHEILPVTSGHRFTIAYDVFATDTVQYRAPDNTDKVDAHLLSLYSALRGPLLDENFLVQGGKLAFGLEYRYPATELEVNKAEGFDGILKGNDYLLFHTLTALSLAPQLRAVYDPTEYSEWLQKKRLQELTASGKYHYPADQFSSFQLRNLAKGQPEDVAFFTAANFKGIPSSSCEGMLYSRVELLEQRLHASIDWDLIWVQRPAVRSWSKASTFARYGNEPDTSFSYVAGVLIVDIPPVGEGARKKAE